MASSRRKALANNAKGCNYILCRAVGLYGFGFFIKAASIMEWTKELIIDSFFLARNRRKLGIRGAAKIMDASSSYIARVESRKTTPSDAFLARMVLFVVETETLMETGRKAQQKKTKEL